MNKHTPGPWEAVSDHDWHSGWKFGVAGVVPVNHTITEANARLIAAAPDLLEALEAIERIKDIWLPDCAEDQHQEEMIVLHKARTIMLAAIAKAKGE